LKQLASKFDAAFLFQLIRFGFVGVAATLTHYIVSIVGVEQLHLSLYLANLLGYIVAVVVSFLGHSKFTFQVNASMKLFSKFIVVSLSALALSELLILLLESTLQLSHRISMLVVVATIPVFTFIMSRLWVYKESAESA